MSVITLDEASAYLRVQLTSASIDVDVLQGVIDAAEEVVTSIVGPLASSPAVAVVQGGPVLVLPSWPVASVVSITDASGRVLADGFSVTRSGVVTAATIPPGVYAVSYAAGWAPLPASIRSAVLEMVRHLWQPQRGSTTRGPDPAGQPPGYLIPNRVRELLDPYRMVSIA